LVSTGTEQSTNKSSCPFSDASDCGSESSQNIPLSKLAYAITYTTSDARDQVASASADVTNNAANRPSDAISQA
jgi:hypothetical protein